MRVPPGVHGLWREVPEPGRRSDKLRRLQQRVPDWNELPELTAGGLRLRVYRSLRAVRGRVHQSYQ